MFLGLNIKGELEERVRAHAYKERISHSAVMRDALAQYFQCVVAKPILGRPPAPVREVNWPEQLERARVREEGMTALRVRYLFALKGFPRKTHRFERKALEREYNARVRIAQGRASGRRQNLVYKDF